MTSVDKITEFARMPEAFEHIRMPEPRSPYSNALRDAMSSYLSEIFEQDNLLTQGMKKMQGLIIYEGSILRGTATEKHMTLICLP